MTIMVASNKPTWRRSPGEAAGIGSAVKGGFKCRIAGVEFNFSDRSAAALGLAMGSNQLTQRAAQRQ